MVELQLILGGTWAKSLLASPLIVCAVLSSALGQQADLPSKLQQRADQYRNPAVIHLEGPIDWKLTKYFQNRLARVKRSGADLLVMQIDSKGGLKVESLNIAEILRDIDWAYTVAYIPREAYSGAALISLGCDEIVMGSQARFGDVGPIEYDPQLFAFRYVEAKAVSVLSRQAQDLAEAKGRSKELAEAMIDRNVMVFRHVEPNGNAEYQTVRLQDEEDSPNEAAKKAGLDLSKWKLVVDSGPEKFLTVNGPTAVDLGLASFLADSRKDLGHQLNVTGYFAEHSYSTTDEVVYWLNTPLVTGLIIALGLIALYVELSAPGLGAGGLIAGLCAALFFWSRFLGGTSGWLEVILFAAGLIFLFMELFVIPGWGISGFAGLLLVASSVILASQDFVVPQTPRQWDQVLNSTLVILCSGLVVIILAGYVTRRMDRLPVLNRLMLAPPTSADEARLLVDKESDKPVPVSHPNVSVGDWGVSESLLRPAGRCRFGQTSLDVVSDGDFIDSGTQVRVVEISGNRIVVAAVESDVAETVWRKSSSG